MTYNSVQHLLNNHRYIGEYSYRDIVVPEGIPAIVPQDLFNRVQDITLRGAALAAVNQSSLNPLENPA